MSLILEKDVQEYPADEVKCPYCGHQQDMSEQYDLINYWDNGETQEMECQDYDGCGRSFRIEERVKRTYHVAPLEDTP